MQGPRQHTWSDEKVKLNPIDQVQHFLRHQNSSSSSGQMAEDGPSEDVNDLKKVKEKRVSIEKIAQKVLESNCLIGWANGIYFARVWKVKEGKRTTRCVKKFHSPVMTVEGLKSFHSVSNESSENSRGQIAS